ncbi:hypothetical protein CYY_001283 [Polysphondylium violaceum]|uniref:phosphatidate phosphatase n=1 Tax=Polysphondylium violaceum TaxID=133409 RepID=A0A8J4Q261_9MYCE|nr:hypothetical protein CYY_001283 [Polysphondylium violaceum]
MNYVEKLFDEVHYVFNLNAATLSGAIDILVIPQLDGSLKCTPFHVRFGKLQLISSSEKVISIYVNNEKTNLQMKLGHAGEAFFVEETEEPVPSVLATSPITSPKPGRASKNSTEELVTELLDKRKTTTTTTTTTNFKTMTAGAKQQQQQIKVPQQELKPLTEAIEEMILNNNNILNINTTSSSSTTTTTTSRPTSPLTTTTTTTTQKKHTTSENITLDSPIGSYIIESPIESPVGSPPRSNIITTEFPSDSENEPKSWVWGGFPKYFRRKKDQQQPQKQQSIPVPVPQQTVNINVTTTTTTSSSSLTTSPTTDIPLAAENFNNNNNSNNSRIEEIIEDDDVKQGSPPLLESEEIDGGVGGGVPIYNPFPTPQNTPNNSLTTSNSIPIDGRSSPIDQLHQQLNQQQHSSSGGEGSSSWKRMGSFLKMWNNKKDISSTSPQGNDQPSFIVRQSSSTSVVSNISNPSSVVAESKNVNNILNSIDNGEIFLLDEEQDQQLEQQQLEAQQQQQQELLFMQQQTSQHSELYSEVVKEETDQNNNTNNNSNDINNNNNNNDTTSTTTFIESNMNDSFIHTTSISTSGTIPNTLIESLSKLNYENEFPALQKEVNNSNGHHHHISNDNNNNNSMKTLLDNFTISLSLCGHLILDRNLEPEEKEAFFKEYIISFEHFCSNTTLLKNLHLVAKINDEYYPWSIAGHIILSYLIFRKPITEESLELLRLRDNQERSENLNLASLSSHLNSPISTLTDTIHSNNNNNTTSNNNNNIIKPTQQSSWKTWLWKSSADSKNNNNNVLMNSNTLVQNINNINNNNNNMIDNGRVNPLSMSAGEIDIGGDNQQKKFSKKTLRPTSDQLKSLGLKKGANRITFVVSSTLQGTREVSASIYLWESNSKIVISDIDGTITKSDVFGQVLPLIGKDWSHIGVAELYSNIKENGYQIIYLTSRAIGQAGLTRSYISSVKQTSSTQTLANAQGIPFTLPEGPVFMSPNRLLTSFNREVIKRNPEEFKIACLQDIQNIFPPSCTPFYAGFGNRITDAIAYNTVGVPKGKTFTINAMGVINTTNTTYNKTYTKLNDLVQDMFPCLHNGKHSVDEQWNEYHYWKKSITPIHKLDPL